MSLVEQKKNNKYLTYLRYNNTLVMFYNPLIKSTNII